MKCRNLQQTCNESTWRTQAQKPKLCQQKGLDGGPGESRTPDQRFRNWAVIPQLVCFQCLQFGQFRAVLGSVGSGTCNGSCNAGRGWPSLSISIPHDRTVPASSERGQIRNLLLTTYSIYLQLVCRPLQSGFLLPACYQQPVRNLWIITPRAESSPSNSTTP